MAPKPHHLLMAAAALAAGPLSGVPLVLAQSADPAPLAAPPIEPPPPVAQPVTPDPPPAPAAVAPPAAAPPPQALRPEPADRVIEAPRSVDASIDDLVRDRVILPSERVRVRGNLVMPQMAGPRERACLDGALSIRECGGGVVVVGRSRRDGLGTTVLGGGGDGGSPLLGSSGSGPDYGYASGERVGIDAAPLPPISVPVTALLSGAGGSFRLTDVFRVTPRPAAAGGNGNSRLLYPLVGSAVTTSTFGWRLHPVIGMWRMHAGVDLAAPEGTPVVAALSGRVVMSGVAGGYGLAVEVEHDRPRRRTLYGHLSELYVKEGDTVRQGEVIGRVGSTGLSTGPHLHFEVRVPQEGGWVAIDPGDLDPGGPMVAGVPGLPGQPGGVAPRDVDAVAVLMGQLLQTLERPRSPLPLPAAIDSRKRG
ncbi:M23 family metallopeptidase [Cyanobium sp. FGCU-52]|nr:M23 family metallopeptidase [Cyanobium sp. FGCU52]